MSPGPETTGQRPPCHLKASPELGVKSWWLFRCELKRSMMAVVRIRILPPTHNLSSHESALEGFCATMPLAALKSLSEQISHQHGLRYATLGQQLIC